MKKIFGFLLVGVIVLFLMPVKTVAGGETSDWDALRIAMQGDDPGSGTAAGVITIDDTDPSVRKITLQKDISAELAKGGRDSTLMVDGEKIILDLNGHTIDGKITADTNVGCVIIVNFGRTLILEDGSSSKTGKITGSSGSAGGGGVSVLWDATFIMNGGTITGNETNYNGGGVFVYENATFIMNGGTITGNKANNNGGGVYVSKDGTFNMNGGTITGNKANQGGGVYFGDGTFNLGGTAVITENTANGTSSNVYLQKDKAITLDTPNSGMSVGVSTQIAPVDDTPVKITTNGSSMDANYFTSDSDAYEVKFVTDHLELAVVPPHLHNLVKVAGQAATTVASGWKDYYECKDSTDACHEYFEDEAGTVSIEDLSAWKAEGGKGYIAPLPPDAIKVTATLDSDTVMVGDKVVINGTVMNGDIPIGSELVTISLSCVERYSIDDFIINNSDGSFLESFKLPKGTWKIHVYYEKDGVKYSAYLEAKVIEHNHNLVKVDGQAATTVASGWKDYYECMDIADACHDYFEDETGNTPIENLDSWKAEGGNGYIAPLSQYTITISGDGNGKATADKMKAAEDEEITLFAFPLEGYSFDYWETSPSVEIADNKFKMPESSIVITAHFKEDVPKPIEVYYAPLVADLKANEDGVIEWKAGDSLPLEAVRLLVEKSELSLEFTFTYENVEHIIFIPAGAFEMYYDTSIPWYGPAWLIERFEKKSTVEYIVKKDDTLNNIAKAYNTTAEEILKLNPNIKNPNLIYPGDKLTIPAK